MDFANEAYFKNVPGYGDLYMDRIILDYDYPLLSVLTDRNGGTYLCICYDTRGRQRWIAVPAGPDVVRKLETDRIDLRTPFTDTDTDKDKDVILAEMDYGTREISFRAVRPDGIPDEVLPAPGETLNN